ncbi:MAG: ABC transporter substrate-binding protein [Pseudomonadota bacterium]
MRIVFAKNADYRPRETGASEWTSGPKIVHFDRVEWQIIPDATTAAIALQKGEIDWWETPTTDYLQLLRRTRNVEVAVKDPTGSMPTLRMNWLNPPFDNPAVRRAVLAAVSQLDTMTVVAGSDPELYRTGVGFFPPGSALASSAGIPPAGKPPDHEAIKRDIIAAGYKGERVVILGVSDRSSVKVMGDVTADLFQRIGLNTDYQMADWGTQNARINSKKPPDQGGWSVYFAIWSGLSVINPIVHQHLRGDGLNSIAGWPDAPKLEALRFAWLDSTDAAEQRRIAVDIQRQAYEDVPYVPLGQFFQPVAYRSDLTGMLAGFPLFWNIKRSA